MKYKESVSPAKHFTNFIAFSPVRRMSRQFFSCDRAIVEALKVFLVHRLILSIVGIIFGLLVLPYFPHPWAESPAYLKANTDPLLSLLVAPWQRWDTEHYLQIAAHGYNNQDGNTVFAPLFPLLAGAVGRLLFSQYMLAGLLIANLAYFGLLVYFYKLANYLFDSTTARYSLRLLAFFPTAFFLLCAYTEALYLALAVAAFYYAEKRRWWVVALLTALASITRLQGGLLILPLLLLYLQQSQFRFRLPFQAKFRWPKIDWAGLALLLSPASLVLFLAYVYFGVGDHNFRQQLERFWGVQLVTPWQALVGGIFKLGEAAQADSFFYNLFNLSLILAFGGLSWLWLRYRLPPAYAMYCFCTLLILLTRQKEGDLWMRMSRYVLALFPVFMLVAWRIRKPGYRTALFALGAVFQVLFVILFLMWRWVA